MLAVFCAPGRYVQGPGALSEIGRRARPLGSAALIVGGKTALALCAGEITASLAREGMGCHQELFGGVSSRREIGRLADAAREKGADLVIALGGGAAIDAGKAVSHQLGAPVIVVPTIIATDAPCSALSVIYREDGSFESYLQLARNPDCILVDTELVVQSPARYLVAGMGDALATCWEADTCLRSGSANPWTGGGRQPLLVRAIAASCLQTLLDCGVQAKLAVERKVVTPAVEAVVEANVLLSGLTSENAGHAGGHAIHNGLTLLDGTRGALHGEKVAFGALAQLVLEGRPLSDIRGLLGFCVSVGLPVTLAEIGLADPAPEQLRIAAEAACAAGETIHATWFPVTAAMVEAAILSADALGGRYRQGGAI